MRTAETTFTPDDPRPAAELLADLEQVPAKRAGRGEHHTLVLSPTPERRGLFRRPEPVPSTSVFRGRNGFLVIVGTLDVLRVGSLAGDLAAAGLRVPPSWTLRADVSNSAGWEVPADEPGERIVGTVVEALSLLPDGVRPTYTARLEHDDGRRGDPLYKQWL